MPDQPHHLIPEEFAGNEWLVDELFEKYQADKNSVDKKWWPIFEQMADEDKASAPGGTNSAPAGKASATTAASSKARKPCGSVLRRSFARSRAHAPMSPGCTAPERTSPPAMACAIFPNPRNPIFI